MLKCVLSSAALALLTVTTTLAQQGPAAPQPDPTAGKVAVPVGPLLRGEEDLTDRERAERTFLMPSRKKMPSVEPSAAAPRPEPETDADASIEEGSLGPLLMPEPKEAEETEETDASAAKPAVKHVAYHRSSGHRRTTKKSSTRRRR